MRKLNISRQHKLGQGDCRVVAQDLLDKLVSHFGGSVSCVGDDYQYQHPTGIKAVVEAREDQLNVNVKLGLMTSALAPKLESEINRVLDEQLG